MSCQCCGPEAKTPVSKWITTFDRGTLDRQKDHASLETFNLCAECRATVHVRNSKAWIWLQEQQDNAIENATLTP